MIHPPKRDFEILFRDSSEKFFIFNARLFCEAGFARFIIFNEDETYKECVYYPMVNIYRVKEIKEQK